MLVCICENNTHKNLSVTGLRMRHATYSRKLKLQKFRQASFFTILLNKIPVNFSTYMVHELNNLPVSSDETRLWNAVEDPAVVAEGTLVEAATELEVESNRELGAREVESGPVLCTEGVGVRVEGWMELIAVDEWSLGLALETDNQGLVVVGIEATSLETTDVG